MENISGTVEVPGENETVVDSRAKKELNVLNTISSKMMSITELGWPKVRVKGRCEQYLNKR